MNKQAYANKIGLNSEAALIMSDHWIDGYNPRTQKETMTETIGHIERKIDTILKRLEQIEAVMQIDYCETKKKDDVFDRWLK